MAAAAVPTPNTGRPGREEGRVCSGGRGGVGGCGSGGGGRGDAAAAGHCQRAEGVNESKKRL